MQLCNSPVLVANATSFTLNFHLVIVHLVVLHCTYIQEGVHLQPHVPVCVRQLRGLPRTGPTHRVPDELCLEGLVPLGERPVLRLQLGRRLEELVPVSLSHGGQLPPAP